MTYALFDAPPKAKPPAPSYSADMADRRILIVDDEEAIRDLFECCLSQNYSCATASGFDEAMTRLVSEPFALIISDMLMPGRSGVELLREVTAHFPDTALIMVSGVDRTQRVLDAVRLGAYDYLIKPCDMDVLEMAVVRALERRALLRDARNYKVALERHNAELKQSREELVRLQTQMVHQEKMASLGQLAAGVAHELNNPAGFIYGNMEILNECTSGLERLLAFYSTVELTPAAAEQVSTIKDEIDYENTLADLHSIVSDCREGAERIRDVVQNLRIFSRLDEAEFKKIDIHEGLESTIRLLSRFYSKGHIRLLRDYKSLPLVDCYAGQLNQVWMNLLANAAHAVKDGGEVSICTWREAEQVVVQIRDTGTGIAPEDLKRIFDPFFTTKPVGEGTGLGLSVTYGIIERHGGSIKVESVLGEGAIFTVTIPVDSKHSDDEGTGDWTITNRLQH